jgi:hypothetical protein
LKSVKEIIKKCYRFKIITTRSLAKVIGILSATRSQFQYASLYLSHLNDFKTAAVKRWGWTGNVKLNPSLIGELKIWRSWLIKKSLNNISSFFKPRVIPQVKTPHVILTTDAAPSGWGATLHILSSIKSNHRVLSEREIEIRNQLKRVEEHDFLQQNPKFFMQFCQTFQDKDSLKTFGVWNKFMSNQSSNLRELSAIYQALISFLPILQLNKISVVQILIDNSTAMYNINRRAASKNLIQPQR